MTAADSTCDLDAFSPEVFRVNLVLNQFNLSSMTPEVLLPFVKLSKQPNIRILHIFNSSCPIKQIIIKSIASLNYQYGAFSSTLCSLLWHFFIEVKFELFCLEL